MDFVVLLLIPLSAVPALLMARSIIKMRKKLINAEKSKQHLKAGLEIRLAEQGKNRQDLEEKLYIAQKEYKCLEEALKLKIEKEEEWVRIQKDEEKQRLVEKEAREKAKKETLERLEAERLQLEKRLSQTAEETKHLSDKLRKKEAECDRLGEEHRKLQEREKYWQAEREERDRLEKEATEKFESQIQELTGKIHNANEEQNLLKETKRELVKRIEDLHQTHVNEKQRWILEIEVKDKTHQETLDKIDAERRNLEGKLLDAEKELILTKKEIRTEMKEKEELKRSLNEKINELVIEYQHLREILFRTQNEYKRLEEETKLGEKQKELEILVDELQHLKGELSKSKEKRKRLTNRLRAINPTHRGGRSRGPVNGKGNNGSEEKRSRTLKPELICWKKVSSWIIGIELPEELECQYIFQDGVQLECDRAYTNRYLLKKMDRKFEIISHEGEKDTWLINSDRDYLIFKLRDNWEGPGRLVRYSTAGYYVIVAPRDWKRDEKISGSASIIPESTQFEELKTHFFYLEKDGIVSIVFNTLDGIQVQVDSNSPRFKLIGQKISDVSDDKGPLFIEEPPLIQSLSISKGWDNIGLIVVGEEGAGGNRWRESFVPNSSFQDQTNLVDLIGERSGWYFLRIYDRNNDLVESMDFRFLKSLQSLQIEGCPSCLPGPNGYENILIRFAHHPDCKVELMDMDKQHLLRVQHCNEQTTVNLPPNAALDKTKWVLIDGGAEVDITITIGRVWWSLSTLEIMPSTWADKSIALSRKDFSAVTNNALWVKLPHSRFTRKIGVGFNQTKKRFYEIRVGACEIAIPLRDFSDCEEILNPKEECLFQIFVDSPKGSYISPVLNIILSFICNHCNFTTTSEQQALLHIDAHLPDIITHLPYDELWRRSGGSLPAKIHKCAYCSFYARGDDLENLTSKICSHIENDCITAIREYGRPKISFSVVTDVDEIRDRVKLNLPHIYRCEICGKEFYGNDRDKMLHHLQLTHRGKVFKFY